MDRGGGSRRRLHARGAVVVALCVATASASAGAAAGAELSAPPPLPVLGRLPVALAGAASVAELTRVAPGHDAAVELQLRGRNTAALGALLAAGSRRLTPGHRFLTPAEFAAEFGAARSEYRAVESWAAASGLRAAAGDGEVTVSGRPEALRAALGGSGAARLPALLARAVRALIPTDLPRPVPLGLVAAGEPARPARPADGLAPANLSRPPAAPPLHLDLTPTPATVQACAAAGQNGQSLVAVGQHYGVGQLQASGDSGQGETIGLYEAAGFSMGDIAAYEACLGVHTQVTVVQIGEHGAAVPISWPGSLEDELDIEQAIAQAPAAHLVVYEGDGLADTWQAIVSGTTVNGSTD